MSEFKAITEAVNKGDINKAVAETQKAIDAGGIVQAIIDEGLIAAMDEVGENFSKGTIFVPQMLRSAKTMQECMKLLEPLLKEGDVSTKGKVLIGTVKGDLHDIGYRSGGRCFTRKVCPEGAGSGTRYRSHIGAAIHHNASYAPNHRGSTESWHQR
jgi:cobalamin-dependent methionine synthase I